MKFSEIVKARSLWNLVSWVWIIFFKRQIRVLKTDFIYSANGVSRISSIASNNFSLLAKRCYSDFFMAREKEEVCRPNCQVSVCSKSCKFVHCIEISPILVVGEATIKSSVYGLFSYRFISLLMCFCLPINFLNDTTCSFLVPKMSLGHIPSR